MVEERSVGEIVRGVRLFRYLDREELEAIAGRTRRFAAPPGTVLIDQSWPISPGLFILVDGEVRVERRTSEGPVHLATRYPGDHLGEMSMLDSSPPSATAVAITEVDTVLLSREAFELCLESSPGLARELLRNLANRLREADDARVSGRPTTVVKKLTQLLLEVARLEGLTYGRHQISLPYSQEEIGRRIGASREAVNKAFRRLQEANPPALARLGGNRLRLDLEILRDHLLD